MKTIKKTTGVFVFVLLFQAVFPVLTFSQNVKDNSDKFVEVHLAKLNQHLTLTKVQEKEICKLLGKLYEERERAQKESSLNSEKLIEKKASQITYQNKLDSILTDEQKNILIEKNALQNANAHSRVNR